MFSSRAELIDQAFNLIQGSGHPAADKLDNTTAAKVADSVVTWLSRFAKRSAVVRLDGTGTAVDFPTTGTLADLEPPFEAGSLLERVEYPANEFESEPLDESLYRLWPSAEEPTHVRFQSAPAAGTNNVLLVYTALHQLDDSGKTRTDLVIGTPNTNVTSAGKPFGLSDLGKTITVTAGAGFTLGAYTIDSISGVIATLSAAVGAIGSTSGHGATSSLCTIPRRHQAAFEYALASRLCKVYAGRIYGHTTSSTIQADAVDYRGQTDKWLRLEENYLDLAGKELGVDLTEAAKAAEAVAPAGAWMEWDPTTRYGSPIGRMRRQR